MKCFAITGVLMCFVLSGCSMQRIDLEKVGHLRVKEVSPEDLKLFTSVYELEKALVVTGQLSRGALSQQQIPGHIDIRVLRESGEEIYSVKANLRRLPMARRRANPTAFSVTFPEVPPKGSLVEVSYDRRAHD